jgi:hypothetical protein
MELPGSGYLLALATISITYAGFAALIVVFRQTTTGKLASYDLFFIRNTLLRSFIITVCAMLPSALAFFELSHSVIWRAASLVAGLLQGAFVLTWRLRRRAATNVAIPRWVPLHNALQIVTSLVLLSAAGGIFSNAMTRGVFVAGLSALLCMSFTGYLFSLEVVLRGLSKKQ